MGWTEKTTFLDEYRKLCEKHKCYVDTAYGKPLYVMSILYPVDDAFEKTLNKLAEDVG